MLKQAIEYLGIGSPFAFAIAAYGLFHFFDKGASGPAKRALSNWLRGKQYSTLDLGSAILVLFDRIYSVPLLTFRAFKRSALISVTLTSGIFFYVAELLFSHINIHGKILLSSLVLSIVASDYLSLFWIRRCLLSAGTKPFASISEAIIYGLAIAIFINGFVAIINQMSIEGVTGIFVRIKADIEHIFSDPVAAIPGIISSRLYLALIFMPAMLVNSWTLMLLAGALIIRLIFPLIKMIRWMQWAIKRGDQHPLRAIGAVAAAMVFLITGIIQLLH